MTGDSHARFCERPGVRFPGPTRRCRATGIPTATLRRLREFDRVCSSQVSHWACQALAAKRGPVPRFGARQTASRALQRQFGGHKRFLWGQMAHILARAKRFTPSAWMMSSLPCVLNVVNSIRAQVVTFSRAPRPRPVLCIFDGCPRLFSMGVHVFLSFRVIRKP